MCTVHRARREFKGGEGVSTKKCNGDKKEDEGYPDHLMVLLRTFLISYFCTALIIEKWVELSINYNFKKFEDETK